MSILKKYRQDAAILQEDFAKLVGVSQGAISKIECGETKPSLDLAFTIQRVTNGAVPAESWIAPTKQGAE